MLTTPYAGHGRVGRGAGVPRRAHARAGPVADARAGAAHRRARARGRCRRDLPRPALPLGLLGPRLRAAPYVVVVHGAEITVPGRLPVSRALARRVLRGAAGIVAAGEYPAREAVRAAGQPVPTLVVPPGVDPERFRPLDPTHARGCARRLRPDPTTAPVVLGVSRLVPRKGFDVLLDAVAGLPPDVQVVIAGAGRDRRRLERHARRVGMAGRTRFLGRVPDEDLPALYGCADVFAMLCRDRWGGLEAEGFGIVFLEAAACGVPSVAGRSGGSHEAVVDGETGFVVEPRNRYAVRAALARILEAPIRGRVMGDAAQGARRARAELRPARRAAAPAHPRRLRGARRHGLSSVRSTSCGAAPGRIADHRRRLGGQRAVRRHRHPRRARRRLPRGAVDRDVPRAVRGLARRVGAGRSPSPWLGPRGATTSSSAACSSCRDRYRAGAPAPVRCAGRLPRDHRRDGGPEPFGVLVPMLPLGCAGLWGRATARSPPRRTGGPGRSTSGRTGA